MKRMKKVISLLLTLSMLLSMAYIPAAADAGNTLKVSLELASAPTGNAPLTKVAAGGSVFVRVKFSGNPTTVADSIQSYDLLIAYNEDQVEFQGKIPTGALTDAIVNGSFDDGILYAGWASADGNGIVVYNDATYQYEIQAEGVLTVLRFTAKTALTAEDLAAFAIIEEAEDRAGLLTQTTQLVDGNRESMPLTGVSYTLTSVEAEDVTVGEGGSKDSVAFDLAAKSLTGKDISNDVSWTFQYKATEADEYEDVTDGSISHDGSAGIAVYNAAEGFYQAIATPKQGIMGSALSAEFEVFHAESVPVEMELDSEVYELAAKKVDESENEYNSATIGATVYDQYGEPMTGGSYTLTVDDTNGDLEQDECKVSTKTTSQDAEIAYTLTYTVTVDGKDHELAESGTIVIERESPEAYTVEVSGDTAVDIPESGKEIAEFTAEVFDQYGELMTDAEVIWSIDPETDKVVIRDETKGEVTVYPGAAEGTYVVIAEADTGASDSIDLEVSKLPDQTLEFAVDEISKTYGDDPFTVELEREANGGEVTYTSDNTEVATVDADGKVTIKGVGEAVITASAERVDGVYASAKASYTLIVGKKEVAVSGLVGVNKTYDGDVIAELDFAGVVFDGIEAGDKLAVSALAVFDDANAGEDKHITISDLALLNTGAAANYKLAATGHQTETTADIDPLEIDVTVEDMDAVIYDGEKQTPDVTVTSDETVGDDELAEGTDYTVTYGENIDAGKGTVSVNPVDGSNYTFTAVEDKEFDILPKPVTVSGITAEDKTFDGSDEASLVYDDVVIVGVISGQELTVTATGTFSDANADEDKTVAISGLTLGGAADVLKNYVLADKGQQSSTTADIVPAEVAVEWDYETSYVYSTKGQTAPTASYKDVNGQDVSCTVTVDGGKVFKNVGTYSFTASTADGNYTLTNTALTGVKIEQAAAPTSLAAAIQTLYSSAITTESKEYHFDLSKIITGVPQDAGDVSYSVSDDDYSVSGTDLSFTIDTPKAAGEKETVVVTVSSINYGDATIELTFEYKDKTGVSVDLEDVTTTYGKAYTVKGSYTGKTDSTSKWTYTYEGVDGTVYPASTTAPKNAGTYQITATYEDEIKNGELPGHIGSAIAVLTINKKDVTITVKNATKTYGADDPAFTGTVAGVVAGDDLNVTYGREEGEDGENAGDEITITASYTENANYNVTVKDGVLTITKAKVTAVIDAIDAVTYSGEQHKPTVTVKAGDVTLVENTDYTVVYGANVNAGTGTVTVKALSGSNYTFSDAKANFTINKKAVTITVDDATKGYGEDDPVFTGTVDGVVAGDDLGVTYARKTGSTGENVGDTVVITAKYTKNSNYTVTVEDGTLTITKASAAPTVAPIADVTYDGKQQTPAVTVKVGGTTLVEGTDYTVVYGANVDAGTGTVTVKALGGNYDFGDVDATFTIKQKAVTITVADATKVYGEADPAFTGSVTGVVAGDDLNVTYDRKSGDNGENVGDSIAVTASYTEDANYIVTVVDGELTITEKAVTITVNDAEKVYGEADPTFTGTVAGVIGSDDLGVTYQRAEGENAGTYAITAAYTANANYDVTVVDGELTISKKAATITVNDAEKVYGEADPTFAGSVTGLIDGDDLNVTYVRESGENAGTYAITATYTAVNYTVTVEAGELTIEKAERELTFDKDTFRILPGKTVTVVPSFNNLDKSGVVTYTYDNSKLSNSGNKFSALATGTVTVSAQIAETDNYKASDVVTLTVHAMTEFQTSVSDEQEAIVSGIAGVIDEDTTGIEGIEDAVSGVEAKAKEIAAKNTGDVPADYGTYTIEVVFGLAAEVLEDNTAGDPASMKLDLEPCYIVYAVSEDGTERTALDTVEITKLSKAVTVSVGLPSGFEPTVAKHFLSSSKVEWLQVTLSGAVASWEQSTFSVVELIEDDRQVTITFDDETITYYPWNIGDKLPTGSKSGASFKGWEFEGVEGTHTTMTDALLTALDGAEDVTATAQFSQGNRPGAERYDVEIVAGKNGSAAANVTGAYAGTVVSFKVKPEDGYKADSIAVVDEKGKKIALTAEGDGEYSFVMPESDVEIRVTFAKDNGGENPFTDVPARKYYYDAVLWAVENGITTGKTATTFDPNGACTRAQVVTFLWRAAGCPAPESDVNPFTDVKEGKYYYDAVLWAVENGITTGTGDGTTFDPNATVSRAQVVTFLFRSVTAAKAEGENPFTDVKAGKYYYEAVLWAVENGITTGKTETTFDPNGACTRGQIVTFLYRHFA